MFWLAAAGVAVPVLYWVAGPLLRDRQGAAPRAAHDLQVFRDQLRSLDREVERGVLAPAEADGARAEISRRLIAAAAEAEREEAAVPAPARTSLRLALGLGVAVAAGTVGVYIMLGQPGMPDRPLSMRAEEARHASRLVDENRPGQVEAEAFIAQRRASEGPAATAPDASQTEARALLAQLREVVATRPDDVVGRRLLADSLVRLGEAAEARVVHEEILDILGDRAGSDDFAAAGEAMILATGGYISPEAESRIARALQRDSGNPIARYYAGLALAQNGEVRLALDVWSRLLEEGPEEAPWIVAIRSQIGDLARSAGAGPAPEGGGLSGALGPSAADIEAASALSAEDRAAMIEDMVLRLEDRLATEGGVPEDWARLLRAYGVLGRSDDAARIWTSAEEAFADAPEALAALRGVAAEAGVAAAADGG